MRPLYSIFFAVCASTSVSAQPCPYIASTLPGDNGSGGFGLYGQDAAIDQGIIAVPYTLNTFDPLGIRLVDITDPANPTEIAIVAVPGVTQQARLELRGTRLWILKDQFASTTELIELDLSDPLNVPPPTVIATGRIRTFEVEGGYLYAMHNAVSVETVIIYDVSIPGSAPVLNAFAPFPGGTGDDEFILHTGILFQSDRDTDSTLRAWSVSDPLNPVLLGETFFPGVDLGIRWFDQVENDVMTASSGGRALLDVSDPNNAVIAASFPGGRTILNGTRAVVRTSNPDGFGVQVFEITDPYQPESLFDARFATSPEVSRSFIGSGSGITLMLPPSNPFTGLSMPPEILVFDCPIDPIEVGENDVCLLENTVIGPDDIMINGVLLADANIKVGRLETIATPATPGFVFPGVPAVSATLTIEGTHTINSVTVVGQSQLIVEGELTTGLLSMSASTGLVNGRIVTDELELLDGAVLSHDAESTSEAP